MIILEGFLRIKNYMRKAHAIGREGHLRYPAFHLLSRAATNLSTLNRAETIGDRPGAVTVAAITKRRDTDQTAAVLPRSRFIMNSARDLLEVIPSRKALRLLASSTGSPSFASSTISSLPD